MLFAFNRDQAEGDFRYDHRWQNWSDPDKRVTKWRKNNDYYNTDALLKYQDDNWFAKLTWQHNKTGFPDTTYYEDADQYEHPYRHQETEKTGLTLGRRQTAGNLEWGWKLDASYQDKEATSMQTKSTVSGNSTLVADNEFRSRRYEGSIDGSWKMAKNHLVEFMFNASRENMKVDTNNFDMWPDYQHSVTGVIDYYRQYFKKDYQTNNYYFQVQDTMTLNRSGNLFFTPVLRAQKMTMDVDLGDPDIGSWKYSYGLGLKKVQNDHWTFRGSYGTYYKFPNWYELFGDGVNVKSRWESYKTNYSDFQLDSTVERGTSWDVSANWQGKAFHADSDVTLSYFNRRAKNLSTYSLDFYGVGYYSNLAAGNIQGLELESKFNWQRWNLLLAATWNDSLITNSGTKPSLVTPAEWQVGSPFPWVPEWEYNVRLSYRFPGDKLTVFGEYHYLDEVGVYYDNAKGLNESLGLTNLGLKYDFNNKIKLTTGVNDLFNQGPDQLRYFQNDVKTYSNSVVYPLQGRTYYMTVQYFF